MLDFPLEYKYMTNKTKIVLSILKIIKFNPPKCLNLIGNLMYCIKVLPKYDYGVY